MTFLRLTDRRARGAYQITDPDAPHGMVTEGEAYSCPHCQAIIKIEPGSGIERGWCYRCRGVTCGKRDCEENCRPWEMQLEEIEKAARNG